MAKCDEFYGFSDCLGFYKKRNGKMGKNNDIHGYTFVVKNMADTLKWFIKLYVSL